VSVAKDLQGWKCDLQSKQGCSAEDLEYLAEAERHFGYPTGAEEPTTEWRGDLEALEAEALKMYYTRHDVRPARREMHLKRISILMHLCARGVGQSWGFAKRQRRDEL